MPTLEFINYWEKHIPDKQLRCTLMVRDGVIEGVFSDSHTQSTNDISPQPTKGMSLAWLVSQVKEYNRDCWSESGCRFGCTVENRGNLDCSGGIHLNSHSPEFHWSEFIGTVVDPLDLSPEYVFNILLALRQEMEGRVEIIEGVWSITPKDIE